ncbi:hypothetical protein [Streptacidiphilus rugosus]|nr:hypothetical protein [Streptacidiphilus rugosus]
MLTRLLRTVSGLLAPAQGRACRNAARAAARIRAERRVRQRTAQW